MKQFEKLYDVTDGQVANAKDWIRGCELDFGRRLDRIAEELCDTRGLRLLRLSGPTCSGKTTGANMLLERFAQRGKHLHPISIDDFYYDKDVLHARAEDQESGNVDYDSVKTIDLGALQRFTEEIFTRDRSHCPVFDFKAGKRISYRLLESGPDDVFIFEGIQAIYPEVIALFEACGYDSVGIYIAPQSAIRTGAQLFEPNEIRLLRRLVRDYNFRGTSPERTFGLWGGVRRNEEQNIFPYAHTCRVFVDSTMPYEIGILKPYLFRILPTVSKDSPHRETAEGILGKLETVEVISNRLILPNSLYKEFI
ncbi:MAG: hypothetical protein IJX94_05000 [Clostridia bacterium]|nr:hypothetical protein [Clostridia bacterium]